MTASFRGIARAVENKDALRHFKVEQQVLLAIRDKRKTFITSTYAALNSGNLKSNHLTNRSIGGELVMGHKFAFRYVDFADRFLHEHV